MPLQPGDKLGPYEVLALIGKGGMGEVYRAHDPRLNRDVAVKVSAAQFTERFEREAKAIAALNHANICQIYDVGPNYLVMEHIEGESPKGPMPLDEALRVARQIADALEAAHDKGITHRDLKPGNIKIKPDGTVKVLDFGLAKIHAGPASSGENSPTLTIGMTQAGIILGTAAYMAPEQARGKESVDKRADIWAFGVVLYELLTGKPLFTGEDVGEILASVIKEQPNLDGVPRQVLPLLKRCLEKDPKKRLRDIGDMELLLAEPPAPPPPAPRHKSWLPWCIAAFLLLTLMPANILHFRETPPLEQRAAQFEVPSPTPRVGSFALSPDGRYLAMSGGGGSVTGLDRRNRLWVRPIDSLEARELLGTAGATYPFWSPDSSDIGFFADGKLKKIALAGGEAQILCDAAGNAGGSWGPNGTILFPLNGATSLSRVLGRVSVTGGVPTPVTKVAAEGEAHKYPEFLPDGRRFLYLLTSEKSETGGIYVGSLDGAPPVRLLPDQSSAAYMPASGPAHDGFLLFRHETTLMALPFNLERLQAAGEMFPLAQQVNTAGNAAHAGFSVSANGTLVYLSGSGVQQQELAWLDRSGKRLGTLAKAGFIRNPAISPDDRAVAVSFRDPQTGTADIWLADVARNAISRFTSVVGAGSLADFPAWSPDGKRIAFSIRPPDSVQRNLYSQVANGTGQPELLAHATGSDMGPYSWSHDGKFIAYGQGSGKTKRDIWLLPLDGDRKPVPYLNTAAVEDFPQFSPDSRWMAYASDESGQNQVYIQAVPQNGTRVQVSAAGGSQPRWRRDGKELFYISADQKMMAAPIQASNASIEAGTPKALFEGAPEPSQETFVYQPTADGQRFLVTAPLNEGASPRLTVVLNWRARSSK